MFTIRKDNEGCVEIDCDTGDELRCAIDVMQGPPANMLQQPAFGKPGEVVSVHENPVYPSMVDVTVRNGDGSTFVVMVPKQPFPWQPQVFTTEPGDLTVVAVPDNT